MPDFGDIASDYTTGFIENAIAARARYEGTSRSDCLECGECIPQRRREAIPGVELCVDCQRERKGRHQGGPAQKKESSNA